MGNVLASNQTLAGYQYNFGYTYKLAGTLSSETYPSGRVVATSYDGANRPNGLSGTLAGQQKSYVSQAAYWPQGDLYYVARGNGVWYAAGYNQLLQPTETYEALNNSQGGMLERTLPLRGAKRNISIATQTPLLRLFVGYSEVKPPSHKSVRRFRGAGPELAWLGI